MEINDATERDVSLIGEGTRNTDVDIMVLPEPFAYAWEEHWKEADTQYGPGDHASELYFDTDVPQEGTKFMKLYSEEQVKELLRLNAP